ncbi:MAG: response regulator receiver protein [Verrucomicrobia bacterium]|nr:response regulator receiver protein [Verrucomicrobiota bacterium]
MTTSRKILVIDDEPDIGEMTKLLLERVGHEVACITDGRQASRLIDERGIEVIITDMLMPDRDGLEVMADMRRKHPSVRIIAASGGGRISSDSYLQIARRSGAHALLPKPFTMKELLASLETAFAPPPALGATVVEKKVPPVPPASLPASA